MSIAMPRIGFRKIATTAALAVAAGSLSTIAMAPAAQAAGPAEYTCGVPLLGDKTFTVTSSMPATVAVGSPLKLTTEVALPDDVAALLKDTAGAATLQGTATADVTLNEAAKSISQKVPVTNTTATGMVLKATGVVTKPTTAGEELTVTGGDFEAVLVGKKADGSDSLLSPYTIPCTLADGQEALSGTATVVKGKTKTKASVKYAKAKKTFKIKAQVKAPVKATGKVTFTVTKNGKKFKTVKANVNKKGLAKVNVKKIKKGKYVVKAKYSGDKNLKGSTGKVKKKA